MRQFTKSEQLFNISKQTLSGGVSSSLRLAMKPLPIFIERGLGARIWDVDGNEYIDYIMGYGPLILGHSHPELLQKVRSAITAGQQYGMPHELEVRLSRRIVETVPCADQVAFSGSGTEAVMLALRLARAYTGRSRIVRFEGHYHGWSDSVYIRSGSGNHSTDLAGTSGQSPSALSDLIVIPWNDFDALEKTLGQHGQEIAAVITEPMMCNSGCIKPKAGYLERLREWTRDQGIVLIFDEVITGFRLAPGGAQQIFGVEPDLATMGKAVAGGFPLSVVAGRREIMDLIETGAVSHLGTLNGNVLSMAAGDATLEILQRNNGEAYRQMGQTADDLVRGMKKIFCEFGIPHLINQQGSVFHLMFIDESEVDSLAVFERRNAIKYSRFAELALRKGLAVRPNGLWYVSVAHTEQDVADTLKIVEKVAAVL